MKKDFLELIVTELLIARLERPDFLASLGQHDDGVDAERQALLDEIDRHQRYLEDVGREAAARHDLSTLYQQEDLIKPRIVAAQRRLDQLTDTDPLVLEIAREEDIREAWKRLELAEQRRLVRAVMKPRVKRVAVHGQLKHADFDRVIPGWR